jgi:cytosine/adenosine deaminase-related metal-dependent hydrolase
MTVTVLTGGHVATVDGADSEYSSGHVVMADGVITAVGDGPAPDLPGATRIDASGTLITPGLVNTHHHLYQWLTRGLATDDTLFGWLTTLYPMWARLTPGAVHAGAKANLAWLALTGCSTTMDHHYVFPAGAGDLLAAEIAAAQELGIRFHPTRGSMNLGQSAGGLPPDEVVEDHESILAASADAVDRWHDPAPGSMLRIGIAPCSPFSVTTELMRDCADLARAKGVRLHTHIAETDDEEDFCRERFGCSPTDYAESVGWLGPDVWLAHCVHLSDDAVARIAATGTGVAHCPTSNGRLGAGVARTRDLLDAGAPVGLGVDGSASNESARMVDELHQAVLAARGRGGPLALTSRDALRLGTMGGAACLGREGEVGSLEVGKRADIAIWPLTGLAASTIADPVAALVLGAVALRTLFIDGARVVDGGTLQTADADELAVRAAAASAILIGG